MCRWVSGAIPEMWVADCGGIHICDAEEWPEFKECPWCHEPVQYEMRRSIEIGEDGIIDVVSSD